MQSGQFGLASWGFHLYREDTPNIVSSLKEAGYRTGLIGKLHILPVSTFPFDFKAIPSGNFPRKHLEEYALQAGKFINESDQPFFLSVNYPDAHRPFIPQVNNMPPVPLTADEVQALDYFGVSTPQLREWTANYFNCLMRLDTMIGELLEVLEKSGKSDNTIVIYIGDHGADMLRGKRTVYEGGLLVPLIVKLAGKDYPAGLRREEMVSTLDLVPTLEELTGIEKTEKLTGMSLVPLLTTADKVPWRTYLYSEFTVHSPHNFYPQRAVRNERYKLIENLMPGVENPGYQFTMNRFFPDTEEAIMAVGEPVSGAYKRMKVPPQFELYDLEADPFEFENLTALPEHKEILNHLLTKLSAWRKEMNDPFLKKENILKLKKEVDASFVDGKPRKDRFDPNYSTYFFE